MLIFGAKVQNNFTDCEASWLISRIKIEEKIKFERMLGNVRENSLFQADSSSPSSQFSSPKSVSFLCGIVGCCHTVAAAAELYEWNV